ncbi:Peptidyl-prolyl cis-trans isomerase PASTICCINO1, partial [Mucuna pruriens]
MGHELTTQMNLTLLPTQNLKASAMSSGMFMPSGENLDIAWQWNSLKDIKDRKSVTIFDDDIGNNLTWGNVANLAGVRETWVYTRERARQGIGIVGAFAAAVVLEANPAHVKGLYRRGMAYMAAGDFEEARADFKMMMKVDKSTESDATAALQKLKKKEQEVEKKDRKQFKGLFDKKPGEISEAKADKDGDQITSESQKDDEVHEDSDGTNSEDSHEAPPEPQRTGWFSFFWPSGRRFFESLGLNRCTIL